MPLKYHSRPGFTLIGFIILVTVVGILGAIITPLYQNYILISRRVEGQGIMLNIHRLQEEYLSTHGFYLPKMSDLGSFESDDYTFALFGDRNKTYTISATAKGSQMSDVGCIFMTLNQAGVRCPGADRSCATRTDCWKQ